MKRAADGSSKSEGGVAKGMPGGQDDKTNPIPRQLKVQEITLHFVQRSWEEIGPGELKYLPLSQTPYYMFDQAMLGQLYKFKNLWATAYYHTPKARMSNLIMLQDDLINQGGTPMETTAFTQACYMLKYQPTKQQMYFQLANIDNCQTGQRTLLHYNLSETKCGSDYSYLINLANYSDFEKLAILPAKIDEYAGFNPHQLVDVKGGSVSQIKNIYIAPDPGSGALTNYGANLQPETIPVIDTLKQVTWCRNLDHISLHKYGDVVEFPITTNLEGVPLLKNERNDLTTRSIKVEDQVNKYEYYQEFCWPGNNRAYYHRDDNLAEYDVYSKNKSFKPLSHHFITMPPIRKANGALLKQRCSFLLEQSFSITFHAAESVWGADSNDEYILNQKNGVILRPNLYGKVNSAKKDEHALWPKNYILNCKNPDICPYDNSFATLINLLIDNNTLMEFDHLPPSLRTYMYDLEHKDLDNATFAEEAFRTMWASWIHDVFVSGVLSPFSFFKEEANICATLSGSSGNEFKQCSTSSEEIGQFIQITANSIKTLYSNNGWEIKKVSARKAAPSVAQHADYVPMDRESTIFFM